MQGRQAGTEVGNARLPSDERAALAEYAARAAWPAGFQIYERGTVADGVFVVLCGRVVLRARARASRGFVPWVAIAGETFGAEGLSLNALYATEARADDETETLFLSSAGLRAFVREQPSHALALIGQIMAERTSLLDKMRELSMLSVEHRLLSALRRMAADDGFLDHEGRIELCTARYRLLCELVGATRESVSLVLGRLTGEGLAERVANTLFVPPTARLFERLGGGAGGGLVVEGIGDSRPATAMPS